MFKLIQKTVSETRFYILTLKGGVSLQFLGRACKPYLLGRVLVKLNSKKMHAHSSDS